MRGAMQWLGGDPKRINPLVPVDLVIDHSVQVDRFGSSGALAENVALEFQRNRERYEFLRWGQKAFRNFRVVPPAVGIVHQVNLEFLAKCVFLLRRRGGARGVARYAGGHRQSHHDDQRPRRGRLGRGRDRGRGGHVGSAAVHARARGDRLRVAGRTPARRHGDGPCAHGHANPPQGRRRRQVRRVFRAGPGGT